MGKLQWRAVGPPLDLIFTLSYEGGVITSDPVTAALAILALAAHYKGERGDQLDEEKMASAYQCHYYYSWGLSGTAVIISLQEFQAFSMIINWKMWFHKDRFN